MGVGIYLFKDFITDLFLGEQWKEASYMIGWWGLTSAITIVLSHYCSEVYRAKGKPKYSVLSQVLHLCFLIPTVLISIRYGFQTLCLCRALIRFSGIAINLALIYILTRITPLDVVRNIYESCIASLVMMLIFYLLPHDENTLIQFGCIFICVISYMLIICIRKENRAILKNITTLIKNK